MATTDARAGFRLPWSSERSTTEETDPAQADGAVDSDASVGSAQTIPPTDWEAPVAAAPGADNTANGEAAAAVEPPAEPGLESARRPRKFLADLTRAMRAATEVARSQSVEQFQAEAKAHIEQIHGRSATEAADLRRLADDDIAAVRDWSKAEIAGIREATERRISDRKSRLEGEVETHAALITREVELVQSRVAAFESEMAEFFERLLAEEDPTRFATLAEHLPEPPPFESIVVTAADLEVVEPAVEAVVEEAPAGAALETFETSSPAETLAEPTEEAEALAVSVAEVAEQETIEAVAEPDRVETVEPVATDSSVDQEVAFAAIQAAAEAVDLAAADSERDGNAVFVADETPATDVDPRMAALGLSADIAEAEAEAAATADVSTDIEEIPEIADDALAARLNGLVPGTVEGSAMPSETTATQVVVTGLVSVASIASFKRHLGRLPGVQSVGVSSGPDGEFVFAVSHAADVSVRDAIPGLPSFQARVTGTGDGTVNVAAHDPESDH